MRSAWGALMMEYPEIMKTTALDLQPKPSLKIPSCFLFSPDSALILRHPESSPAHISDHLQHLRWCPRLGSGLHFGCVIPAINVHSELVELSPQSSHSPLLGLGRYVSMHSRLLCFNKDLVVLHN